MTQNCINTNQKLVQLVTASSTSATKTSTTAPYDDTIPQNTEGGEMLTVTITPISPTSTLLIEWNAFGFGEIQWVSALFQDTTAGALAAIAQGQNTMQGNSFRHVMTSGTTSATTFKIRVGTSSTFSLNSSANTPTRVYGGVSTAWLSVKEYL